MFYSLALYKVSSSLRKRTIKTIPFGMYCRFLVQYGTFLFGFSLDRMKRVPNKPAKSDENMAEAERVAAAGEEASIGKGSC
jgi:hypothetical protein